MPKRPIGTGTSPSTGTTNARCCGSRGCSRPRRDPPFNQRSGGGPRRSRGIRTPPTPQELGLPTPSWTSPSGSHSRPRLSFMPAPGWWPGTSRRRARGWPRRREASVWPPRAFAGWPATPGSSGVSGPAGGNRASRPYGPRGDPPNPATSRRAACRFPGCERKRWLNAHHLVHWADGGGTNLDNLILLCHAHHRLIHEGGWRTSGHPGHDLRFHDPGGRPLRTLPLARQPGPDHPIPARQIR
jgi:hypothetical protein